MADEDLKKILGEDTDTTPPEEKKEPAKEPELSEEDQEIKRKEEQKRNLDKAIAEAQAQLRKTRQAAKAAKSEPEEEEELPVIDLKDPSAKAWDRRIKEHVAPAQRELEQEKEEVFDFTFREYLKDHPYLASNDAKRKEFLETYERVKKSSGRTQEGVRMDLDTAFGATFHEELLNAARAKRVEDAKADMLFSEPAVSRGSTAYSSVKPEKPKLSDDDRMIIARWEGAGAPKVE